MKNLNLIVVGAICFAAGLLAGLSIAVLCQTDRPAEVAAAVLPIKAAEKITTDRACKLMKGASLLEAGYFAEPFVPMTAHGEYVLILTYEEKLAKCRAALLEVVTEVEALQNTGELYARKWMQVSVLLHLCTEHPYFMDAVRHSDFQQAFQLGTDWYNPAAAYKMIGSKWLHEAWEVTDWIGCSAEMRREFRRLSAETKNAAQHKPVRTAPDYRPYDGSNVEGDVGNGAEFGENKGEIGSGIGLGPTKGFGPAR